MRLRKENGSMTSKVKQHYFEKQKEKIMKEQSKAKLIIDGEEYIFGEKYFMLSTEGEWSEDTLFGYDSPAEDLPFLGTHHFRAQISKTDPTDKRNLLKGYGVVCVNQEQADIMQEFVGDLFSKKPVERWNGEYRRTFKYSGNYFIFGCDAKTHYSLLGNLTFEQACEMCGIEPPKPKMRYMTAMEVIQQHNYQRAYKRKGTEEGVFITSYFDTQMNPEDYVVCKDTHDPIDKWVWEELKV